jgi:hypothetical protein
MGEQIKMEKITLKHYVIIFVLFIVANSVSTVAFKTFFAQSDANNQAVLINLKALGVKISEIETIVKSGANKVKLKDRLDPALVAEFGDDDVFLQKIAVLKKQIVRRRLESEVIKLDNEKIARDATINDDDAYNSPYKKNIAARIFEVMMINSSSGIAIVRVDGNVVTIKKGDNIKNFTVRKINSDSIVVRAKNGEDEVLGLNYLNSKLNDKEQKDNEDVKE